MKMSVSNIAWDTAHMKEYLGLLSELGVDLEFSPSMVWKEPVDISLPELKKFRNFVASFGLNISGMHSLTYTRPDLVFFGSEPNRAALIEYIVRLGEMAHELAVPVMVFGSSKSRAIGDRDRTECLKIMADTFHQIAERLQPLGVCLLIEPLSKRETDSINNMHEAYELMTMVQHQNFLLHVDLKSSFAEQENQAQIWSRYAQHIRHCHVADPGLKPPSEECPDHFLAARAIRDSCYRGYISIEMGRCHDQSVVRNAVEFVKKTYC